MLPSLKFEFNSALYGDSFLQVVTVFSAPNYCDRHGNKGAVCVLHGDDVSMPEFKKFEAAPHPKVDPLKYASTLMRLGVIG